MSFPVPIYGTMFSSDSTHSRLTERRRRPASLAVLPASGRSRSRSRSRSVPPARARQPTEVPLPTTRSLPFPAAARPWDRRHSRSSTQSSSPSTRSDFSRHVSQDSDVTSPEASEGETEKAGYARIMHATPARGRQRLPHRPSSIKHLPRAERLPVTGYELLAASLSARASIETSSSTHPQPKPLYRRFEALNHRILLHLQDELGELEEQLHRLDTADTQTRRLPDQILPASRRAGLSAGGELQWHKTDILLKISRKLAQYNHVLSSFTETQSLAAPQPSDVHDYRAYLAAQKPIAESETRFLEAAQDLVTLAAAAPRALPPVSAEPAAPRPSAFVEDSPLLLALAAATLVPVLMFSGIPSLMAVVAVVAILGGLYA